MPNFITYPELTCLSSDNTLVLNNYHGMYDHIKNKNYRVVIYTCFGEVLNAPDITRLLEKFSDSYVIIVTARHYPELLHCGDRYQILVMPNAYAWYTTKIPQVPINLNKNFKKRFLSLNNRAQWTRHALAQMLIQFDLLDQFYFSYHCGDRWNIGLREVYDQMNSIIGTTWFNKDIDIEEMFKQLPITTGLDKFFHNDWTVGNDLYYNTSFCSIVTETYIDENEDPFFTEKIMKPLAFAHPFFLSSSTGALAKLHKLGFKTFSNFFDESYDSIESSEMRIESIFNEILRLSKLPDSEINIMYRGLMPIIQHNYDFFWNEFHERYQQDMIYTKEKISDILSNI